MLELKGDGRYDGVLILSSSPTHNDISAERAFGSKSGMILRRWAAEVGFDAAYFDYVIPYEVNRNLDKNPFIEDYEKYIAQLSLKLSIIKPKVIIACGEFATRALTSYENKTEDIHCYVINDTFNATPVIPTFHPNELMQQPTNAYWMKFAFQKAKAVFDGRKDAPLELLTTNSFETACDYISVAARSKSVAIDIETNKFTPELSAIGISYSIKDALSISRDTLSEAQWNHCIQSIVAILQDPTIEKVGQNIMFDFMMLWKAYGVVPQGEIWDTMHAANVINCEIEKSLKALGRLYFYCAPWKGHWNTTGEKLRIYNAQDVGFTNRIAARQRTDLERHRLSDYFSFIRQLFLPSFHLATRGICLDVEQRKCMLKEVDCMLRPYIDAAADFASPFVPPSQVKRLKRNQIADEKVTLLLPFTEIPAAERKHLYIAKKKDIKFCLEEGVLYQKAYKNDVSYHKQVFNAKSPKQLMGVLHNAGVKIPKVKKSNDEWGESTNDKALAKIIERNTDSAEIIAFVNNMRMIRIGSKLLTSYCKAPLDEDGRWRCTYNIEGTKTGRSSTKKTPWGTGGNNQNIPRGGFAGIEFKKLFVADSGKTLFQSDQEQAEARVVAYLSGCKTLIDLFEHNQDIHTYAISAITGEDIVKWKESNPEKFRQYRQYGKIVNHGGNYDMGAATLSESAIKQGIVISVKDAEFFLASRRIIFPEIYAWHKEIQQQIAKDRTLITPFGRRRVFMGTRDHKLFREAYAFIPQSTIPHITNMMWLWANQHEIEVLQHGHDALLMQVNDANIESATSAFLAATRELRFGINGLNVNIPWDMVIGKNWANLEKINDRTS